MVASISAISRSFLRICAAVASRSFATRCRSVMIPGSAAVLSGRRLSGWLVRTWLAVGAAVEDTAVREREREREGERRWGDRGRRPTCRATLLRERGVDWVGGDVLLNHSSADRVAKTLCHGGGGGLSA